MINALEINSISKGYNGKGVINALSLALIQWQRRHKCIVVGVEKRRDRLPFR